MNIVRLPFPKEEYIQEKIKKEMIVLHHTVSSNYKSVLNWWCHDAGSMRVATAYIVDKDGTIYKLFDENFWAYHIGKGSTKYHNQRSIGIEIVNEGPLVKVNGGFFWFDGRARYKNKSVYMEDWRGEHYWAPYTNEQFESTLILVRELCNEHNIQKQVLTGYDFRPDYREYCGIVSHHNLRADKTDLSPAFNLNKFKERLCHLNLKPKISCSDSDQ